MTHLLFPLLLVIGLGVLCLIDAVRARRELARIRRQQRYRAELHRDQLETEWERYRRRYQEQQSRRD